MLQDWPPTDIFVAMIERVQVEEAGRGVTATAPSCFTTRKGSCCPAHSTHPIPELIVGAGPIALIQDAIKVVGSRLGQTGDLFFSYYKAIPLILIGFSARVAVISDTEVLAAGHQTAIVLPTVDLDRSSPNEARLVEITPANADEDDAIADQQATSGTFNSDPPQPVGGIPWRVSEPPTTPIWCKREVGEAQIRRKAVEISRHDRKATQTTDQCKQLREVQSGAWPPPAQCDHRGRKHVDIDTEIDCLA